MCGAAAEGHHLCRCARGRPPWEVQQRHNSCRNGWKPFAPLPDASIQVQYPDIRPTHTACRTIPLRECRYPDVYTLRHARMTWLRRGHCEAAHINSAGPLKPLPSVLCIAPAVQTQAMQEPHTACRTMFCACATMPHIHEDQGRRV